MAAGSGPEQSANIGLQHQRPQLQQHNKLSDAEVAVLKECENESFFRRALPLSCGAFLGAQFLVRSGKLARHPKLGALPKSMIAGGIAYLFGKISYLPECRKKILERIPDSSLAAQITKGNRGLPDARQQDGFDNQLPARDNNEDYGSKKSKYSTDAPSYEGLNDSLRPSVDNEVKSKEEQERKKSTTYDDLRERNRQDYKESLSSPNQPKQPGSPSYKDSPYMPQKTWPDRNAPSSPPQDIPDPPTQAPSKRKRTNIWGDVIED